VRAERTAAEPVYSYECYLRGLPFYLGETVRLVSPHSDDLRLGRITRPTRAPFSKRQSSRRRSGRRPGLRGPAASGAGDAARPRRAPAVDPGVVAGHVLISNRPGSRRSRELRALLDAGGQALEDAFARLRPVAARWRRDDDRVRGPGRRADLLLEPGARRRDTRVSFAIAGAAPDDGRAGSSAGGDDRGGRVPDTAGSLTPAARRSGAPAQDVRRGIKKGRGREPRPPVRSLEILIRRSLAGAGFATRICWAIILLPLGVADGRRVARLQVVQLPGSRRPSPSPSRRS